MKKSNKEVLDFLGLKVGDMVKTGILNCDYCDYFVIKRDGLEYAESAHCSTWCISNLASILFEHEYEIATPKKKIGEMKCEDFVRCKGCPFALNNPASNVCCIGNGNKTFREIVESTQKELDDIKSRLDKEVQECEK